MTEYAELAYTDNQDDRLEASLYRDGEAVLQAVHHLGDSLEVLLNRDQVLDLYHRLGDHLVATRPDAHRAAECTVDACPDATADGYDWPAKPLAPWERELLDGAPQGTVLDQAKAAVYGDREADYGHPREDFTRQAILYTGLLQHKLADGAYIEAEDIARLMIATKLARDVHSPKRDNRVDGAGYFLTLDRLATGQ